MATDTQVSGRFQEKGSVLRSVRIMATKTSFLFHCRMDTRAFRGFIVALVTEGATIFHQDQVIGIAVIIVTRFAIRFLDR